MERPISFRARIRRWRDEPPGGLAVIDVPAELVAALGGRRQYRASATINGAEVTGSTMLVAGGGFCVGIGRAALRSVGVGVGDEVEVVLRQVGRP